MMITQEGRIIEWDDEPYRPPQPRCPCGAWLPWRCTYVQFLDGYDQPFDVEQRTCTRCGLVSLT